MVSGKKLPLTIELNTQIPKFDDLKKKKINHKADNFHTFKLTATPDKTSLSISPKNLRQSDKAKADHRRQKQSKHDSKTN